MSKTHSSAASKTRVRSSLMQQQEVKKKFDRYQVLDWMEEEGLFYEGLVDGEEGAAFDEELGLSLH